MKLNYSGLKVALDMAANNFTSPLLKEDAMDREINAVESEFRMCFPDDNVRALQIMSNETADKKHIFNRFAWGNLQSLKGQNAENLLSDLKEFYDATYSADRTKLVIQVKSSDNLQEVRSWVEESFSIIPNKKLGLQDFSKNVTDYTGKLPFDGNENEMLVMNTVTDLNKMILTFSLPYDFERMSKKSYHFIFKLLGHKGEGSFYQCLKALNYVVNIEYDYNRSLCTAFRAFIIEIELTEQGIQNYQRVLALLFEYLRVAQEEWLATNAPLDLFNETK